MRIRVLYADGAVEAVPASVLNALIRENQVLAFERSSGWTCIDDEDPIRRKLLPYAGPGKRGYDVFLN